MRMEKRIGDSLTRTSYHIRAEDMNRYGSIHGGRLLTLADEIDISRGDMLVHAGAEPKGAKVVEAMVCWMGEEPLSVRKKYVIKHTTNSVKAMVDAIVYRTDIQTLAREDGVEELAMNDIGRVAFKLQKPMLYDAYADNHATGSFIIIDSFTNNTVGAGMICKD